MFRALMGGSRSSSDVRSTSSSKSGRRRTDSKASSTSRKSSRGDDRDRGLGDLSTYPTAGGRNKRYAASAAGESVASSYATADPGVYDESDRVIIERRPGRWDDNDNNDDDEDKPRDRDLGDVGRQQSARRPGTDDRWEADDRASAYRERQRAHPDVTLPPISTAIPTTGAEGASPNGFAAFDPHPYRPPNPAGEAADYYGDQGQSVADQPGIRPTAPEVLPNNQAHLMPASSTGAATYGVGDPSHSHGGTGAAVGMAAAAAGAGSHGSPPYPMQPGANVPNDAYAGPAMYPPNVNPALYSAGAGASGGMAFHQRRRGPLDRFVDFWRDPDGVGMFEDYTESIGVCKYCFEPGSTSRDAPRKHHYEPRRHSGDRRSGHSHEGRHRKRSSRSSWIPGLLGGYGIKSLFNTKDFEDTERGSVSGRQKSDTSRGVYRHVGKGRYAEPRRRSRSRSRSSSRPHRHSALRDAALGAARSDSRSRSRSPRKSKGRKSSSSDSSFVDIGHPSRKSTGGAFGSFFTALFSFNNSSSSSTDADLAFGSGYAKKPPASRKKKRGKKQDRDDVDAKLLGLGAAATALAASPHGRSRRPGEVLLGKESRTSRSDYASSATNDDGWEDLDSSDQSSALFSSDDSSDSGTKKDKKKTKKRTGSGSSDDRFPAGAAALGDSTGSLQHVAPVPTSDPSRYDTVRIPSSQPAFVRPAVYTSQGESIHAYTTPTAGPAPSRDWDQPIPAYVDPGEAPGRIDGLHRRSNTFPTLKRRATAKDQASVSFNLTEEQERRADRLQLIDNEREPTRSEDDRWSRGSNDDSSQASSQRRHDERREKRRAERRRGPEPESASAAFSAAPSSARDSRNYPTNSPWSPEPEPAQKPPRRNVSPTKPKYEDYAEFFAPKEVRRRSDDSSRGSRVMPTIIEVVPASEKPESPIEPDQEFLSRVPWKVPDITYTDPTPPHSVSGSVRDAASPAPRPQKVTREEESPKRPVTFSRVSWGEHETHEYEVPSSDSDRDSVDYDRVRRRARRERGPKEDSGRGIGEDIAFAATVAAATAAAGFDPSLVTDDPKYHTRSSPPHDRFSRAIEQDEDEPRGEKPSRAREVAANGGSSVQRNVDTRDKPESPTDVALHMPGGFEEPERQADSRDVSIDDPRSVVSAPAPGDFAERVPKDLQRRVSGDTEEGDDTGSPSVESGSADAKKKRRKKHSKRNSDGLDDSASVASSPAKIGDDRDKRRGTKEKNLEEKSGNFFSNIFGSRVSEPVESQRPSSSSDRRETRSEIGSRTPEESRHRRQDRSSRHRSSNRGEGPDDDASAREDDMVADKENINVESYKSSRQRREERRRQRYEWDNKVEESEKV
ncbi:hypothetical protein BDW42DRAFT_188252 [Aspergillus taichungensis]|uniref:Involucrin repeat protein n=1 Tax=Aspergillus taichungensis TaxID=482145 RepID=A0A2J5HJ78_9EURO|nr:hypothetical protein BDW42DRAFT_188252 [Aspergillus taichungensis]